MEHMLQLFNSINFNEALPLLLPLSTGPKQVRPPVSAVPSRAQYLLLRFDFKSFIEDLSSQPLKMWAISKLTATFHVFNDVPALRVERVPPCWILYLINSEPYIASCPRNSRLLL